MIRSDVIFRKITFGNRSQNGLETHSVLTSILQTAKLNNLDPLKTLERILLSKDKTSIVRPDFERMPDNYKDISILEKIFLNSPKRKPLEAALAAMASP